MSGIAAVVDGNDEITEARSSELVGTLEHRGPGPGTVLTTSDAGLGCQSSPLDRNRPTTTKPVQLDDLIVCFDGRIDNARALRSRLSLAPTTPRRHDAELVARGFRSAGTTVFERIRGPFAAVVWDDSERELHCARDRTGIRHLYYSVGKDGIVVGSEMQTVVHDDSVAVEPDVPQAGRYVLDGHVNRTSTFYRGVQKIPPGCRIRYSLEDGLRKRRYWHPFEDSCQLIDRTTAVRRLSQLLSEAVQDRIEWPDAPGVMMSGGLDSTSVASLAQRHFEDHSIRTYSAVFPEFDSIDELSGINTVVSEYDLDSTLIEISRRELRDYSYPRSSPGPIVDASLVQTQRLCERAAGKEHSLLTGIGGNLHDGGRYHYLDLRETGRWFELLKQIRFDSSPRHRWLFYYCFVPTVASIPGDVGRLRHDRVESPEWLTCPLPEFDDRRTGMRPSTYAGSRLMDDLLNGYMDLARDAVRRIALDRGLELRHPLMDCRVVKFLCSTVLVPQYWRGTTKSLFRDALDGILPTPVRTQSVRNNRYDETVDALIDDGMVDEFDATPPRVVRTGMVSEAVFNREDCENGAALGPDVRWRLSNVEQWLRRRPVGGDHAHG